MNHSRQQRPTAFGGSYGMARRGVWGLIVGLGIVLGPRAATAAAGPTDLTTAQPSHALAASCPAEGGEAHSTSLWGSIFDTSDFPPRWYCGQWSAALGWTHIVSDLLIFGAYSAIPLTLAFFIRKRRDMPFPKIFWLFSAFIFACGVGHLIEAAIFWWPAYRVAAVSKAATALVSWATVLALLPILPKALNLPSVYLINKELRKEIMEHSKAVKNLQEKQHELTEANEELERFNRLTMGRENRIMELKAQVNRLSQQLGQPRPYHLQAPPTEDAA